ncbi:hypothetical protein [Nostoc sp. 'Peltigera malacea cyanobiont' DB3992]|uniref:hypothetical protein n=1 Tax=Nostoc sp. 'Peltigera malacea cyanobiont' DB3992 TaxID=1206980 RepID=UPI000C052362|nr:hypothetical protein [Nostoc sp. 'Peltigera malacea cyanobiont' DB3992]PHM10360.1 hypothetical protein CK516_09020 [Nostoc sp. 'Peltigera malacea cyanobiont' DB3992]
MKQEFPSGYVYHKQLVADDELGSLITQVSNSQSYYFLRYSHAVSGICKELPDERGEIEGQVFNSICEMRWKKDKSGYDVLILSQQKFDLKGFEKLTGNWKICDRDAYWHNPEETRFPKGFTFKGENNQSIKPKEISIKQRYFKDSATATIHFVALTVN